MAACNIEGAHFILVRPQDHQDLESSLRAEKAVIYTAHSTSAALGQYWELYVSGRIPRMIITPFWVTDVASRKAFSQIGKPLEATCIHLLNNVHTLDTTCAVIVYDSQPQFAKGQLYNAGLDLRSIDVVSSSLSGDELIDYIDEHEALLSGEKTKTRRKTVPNMKKIVNA